MMVCACRSSEFRRGNVDEILARAGIFQGVQPSAVAALTKQLQPVDFPRGHTVFAEGEPGDRLYIILSGKVKIGRRSRSEEHTSELQSRGQLVCRLLLDILYYLGTNSSLLFS